MTMIGMPIGKKTPKSELHEFYQLHPGNPAFTIKSMSNPPAEPLFLCTLTCPGIGGPQGLPEQSFTGQGRNKKTAEQYAAEKALGFLRQRGSFGRDGSSAAAARPAKAACRDQHPDNHSKLIFPDCLYQNLLHT